tara:strand:+ start:592 stop:885 length:294 start_codon:yes stop_codon:yes gene_type:complete
MKVTFKENEDNKGTDVFLQNVFLGTAKINVWNQKWNVLASFYLPYNFAHVEKKNFFSAYEAGKELVEVYKSLFLREEEKQEFGISLDEMLSYLSSGS